MGKYTSIDLFLFIIDIFISYFTLSVKEACWILTFIVTIYSLWLII